jgi:TonB family protein
MVCGKLVLLNLSEYTMQRTILTYSPLLVILAFFMLGLAKTSNAQADIEALTANSSVAIQAPPEENKPQENLDYLVNTWSSPVTKEEVKQITSILDFWSAEDKAKYKHDAFRDIWVVNLKDYPDWTLDVSEIAPKRKATGPTEEFTKEQLALVANADYSDHLRFSARFNSTRIETGEVKKNVLVSQSVSLVPDVQAAYKGGFDALVDYLKEASKDMVKHVKRDKVGRCRVFFTVTNKGSITDVKLVETSNYADVDKAMIKLIKDIPQKWTPAQNGKGKKVGQEFVFTFGVAGC